MAEQSRKYREASAVREAGVVSRWKRKENHPVCAQLRRLRDIFLMGAASPPLLRLRAAALALISRQTCLARRVLAPPDEVWLHWPAQPCGDQFSLVEPTLPLARPVEWHRNNQIACEGFPRQTLFQNIA